MDNQNERLRFTLRQAWNGKAATGKYNNNKIAIILKGIRKKSRDISRLILILSL